MTLQKYLHSKLIKGNGKHTSEDMPPKIPFFTGIKANRTPTSTESHSASTSSLGAVPAPTSTTEKTQHGEVDLEKKVRIC